MTFTFIANYFQCHNSLSVEMRTQYKGMCLAFLTTIIATSLFIMISVIVILKEDYHYDDNDLFKFIGFGKLHVAGELGILLLLLHSPVIYFNGKDMLLTLVAELRS